MTLLMFRRLQLEEELPDMSFVDKTPAYMSVRITEQEGMSSLRACADTGSAISLLDEGLYNQHFAKVATRPCRFIALKGVGGQTIITRCVVLTLLLEDTRGMSIKLPIKLYINPAEGARIILGTDFMTFYGASVDVANQVLTFSQNVTDSDVKIRVTTRRDPVPTLRAAESLIVRPFHTARLRCKLNGTVKTRCYYMDPTPIRDDRAISAA